MSDLLQSQASPLSITDPEQIDDIIDKWHAGEIKCEHLHDALGWTWEQYKYWVENSIVPIQKK
jgi:hypothetical protein